MASLPGLGLLQVLPSEIRELVYEHFMHYNNYTSCSERPRYRHTTRIPSSDKSFSLALLRVSRAVYTEMTSLLYDDWHLQFTSSADHYSDQFCTPWGFFPKIELRVSNIRRGTYYLPLLTGPVGCWDGPLFRNIPYHRWQSVIIELLRPNPNDEGSPFLSWRASKLIAWVLQSHPPRLLRIEPRGTWKTESGIVVPTDGEDLKLNLLQALLTPFEYLPSSRTKAQGIFPPIKVRADRFQPQHNTAVTQVEVSWSKCEGVQTQAPTLLPGSVAHQYFIDLWFEDALDGMRGDLAARLRFQRWLFWSLDYEKRTIRVARRLKSQDKERVLAALAERWSVMRAMDSTLRQFDYSTWRGHHKDASPLDSSAQNYQKRSEPIYKWRAPVTFGNPREGDGSWQMLKYDGLFYHRRIVVSLDGIFWDPEHTKHKQGLASEASSSTIYVHQPPARPSQRPPRTQPDPHYTLSGEVFSDDSDEDC
ncbi:MAG: hypothetical protein M1828_004385 [Chrysothrix sp. TS-e1954]|nr:MAG: hypothetical protein M1828_004385 [Chrysothrix sp. TS-e1954]